LTEDHVLVLKGCPEMRINKLRAQYGKPLDDILQAFDGSKKVREVLESLSYDPRAMWFIINKLVEEGCLGIK